MYAADGVGSWRAHKSPPHPIQDRVVLLSWKTTTIQIWKNVSRVSPSIRSPRLSGLLASRGCWRGLDHLSMLLTFHTDCGLVLTTDTDGWIVLL